MVEHEQWKAAYSTHDGRLVHHSGMKIQMMCDALERGYDETSGITGYQYLQTVYTNNKGKCGADR